MRRAPMPNRLAVAAFALAALTAGALGQSGTLSTLPGAEFLALSANGEFAVGSGGASWGIRWSPSGGITHVGPGGINSFSTPTGVSADGSVVTGTYTYN